METVTIGPSEGCVGASITVTNGSNVETNTIIEDVFMLILFTLFIRLTVKMKIVAVRVSVEVM
jgi:hypothetical protein